MKQTKNKVALSKFGYYTLAKKPTPEELKKYYRKKYYQAEEKYSSRYTRHEIENIFNKLDQKYQIIIKNIAKKPKGGYGLLDIGAGEGWTLKYFRDKHWQVTGIDFSDFGCKTHNPNVLRNLIVGDIEAEAEKLIKSKKKYDLIWLDNVLEHVVDPQKLLNQCKKLSKSNAILIIEVPNDFSIVQRHLLKHGYVSKPYWIISPDHISYFNKEALNNLCESHGWENFDSLADFPIDFFLFNRDTNYVKNKKVGKQCHFARVRIENFMASLPQEKTLAFFRNLAELGLGRQLIGFYKLTKNGQSN